MTTTGNAAPIGAISADHIERFYARTRFDPETGCVLWTGARRTKAGYGALNVNGRVVTAHRFAWAIEKGCEAPDDMTLAHTCHNGAAGCVTVEHLVPMTLAENAMDTPADRNPCVRNALKTRCAKGHDYEEHGEWRTDSKGRWGRRCVACEHERYAPPLSEIEISYDPFLLDQMVRAA